MSDNAKHDELAGLLAAARPEGRQIMELDHELVPASADDAYRINAKVAARLGWPTLGWKIASTTDAVRTKLRTDGPIYGRTFQRFKYASPGLCASRGGGFSIRSSSASSSSR